MEDKNYFDDNSISYSQLRNLSVGPAYFKKIQEEEQEDKEHFIIGSCVDTLLTEPDKFWEKYTLEFSEVCEKVPTGQMKDYLEFLLLGNTPEAAYNFLKEQNGGKLRDNLEKFKEKAKEWEEYTIYLNKRNLFNKNCFIEHKQTLTNEQYSLISRIVQSLKTNRFTRKYFEINDNIEIKSQLEIYWEYKGEKCKSKLDLVLIDHNLMEIHTLDIKTTGKSPFSFNLSALQWRYDLQAAFYSTALYWLINKSNNEEWGKYKFYKIKPFKFIVESSKYPGLPLIYEASEKFLIGGAEGFTSGGRYYKGFVQLMDEFKWYKDNNSWDYPKDVIENEGVIKLDY